jgi:hypothetical protein
MEACGLVHVQHLCVGSRPHSSPGVGVGALEHLGAAGAAAPVAVVLRGAGRAGQWGPAAERCRGALLRARLRKRANPRAGGPRKASSCRNPAPAAPRSRPSRQQGSWRPLGSCGRVTEQGGRRGPEPTRQELRVNCPIAPTHCPIAPLPHCPNTLPHRLGSRVGGRQRQHDCHRPLARPHLIYGLASSQRSHCSGRWGARWSRANPDAPNAGSHLAELHKPTQGLIRAGHGCFASFAGNGLNCACPSCVSGDSLCGREELRLGALAV